MDSVRGMSYVDILQASPTHAKAPCHEEACINITMSWVIYRAFLATRTLSEQFQVVYIGSIVQTYAMLQALGLQYLT